MQAKLIVKVISMLLSLLTPELLKAFADMVLDFAEECVIGTASKVDDKLILPICDLLRAAFDIPDND
jgi:hypothetical protein